MNNIYTLIINFSSTGFILHVNYGSETNTLYHIGHFTHILKLKHKILTSWVTAIMLVVFYNYRLSHVISRESNIVHAFYLLNCIVLKLITSGKDFMEGSICWNIHQDPQGFLWAWICSWDTSIGFTCNGKQVSDLSRSFASSVNKE